MKRLWILVPLLASGACGGSTGDGEQRDPDALIVDACSKMTGCSSQTPDACQTQMHEERDGEAKTGCTAQFDAVVSCIVEKLSSCGQKVQDLCAKEFDALDLCHEPDGGQECSMGYGGAMPGAPSYYQSCMIGCPTWSVDCETKDSPTLVCTCTQGPKSGTTFTPAACKDVTVSLATQYCSG